LSLHRSSLSPLPPTHPSYPHRRSVTYVVS
jgi:hypothetical protein